MAQKQIASVYGPQIRNKHGAETAGHLNLLIGKATPASHLKVSGWTAGTRVFGHGAVTEATISFQGTGNPTGYVRMNPAVSQQGHVYASHNLAFHQGTVSFLNNQHKASVPNASKSRESNPPFLRAYGPSLVKGNRAAPEAAAFPFGGGAVNMMRAKGTGHIQLSTGL